MHRIIGRDHIVIRSAVEAHPDVVPRGWHVHMLYLRQTNGKVEPAWQIYDYFVAHHSRSDTWQACGSRACGLLYDYSRARLNQVNDDLPLGSREVLRGFYTAMVNGTISDGQDPLGLYWFPQSLTIIRNYLNAIDRILSWMVKEKCVGGFLEDAWAHPHKRSFYPGKVVQDAKRLKYSLLGYLESEPTHRSELECEVKSGRTFSGLDISTHVFPPHLVEPVLWEGFRKSRYEQASLDNYDVRGMMIFLLQAFAGLREHEAFHIWTTDVIESPSHPGIASVVLYHPVFGLAYVDGLNGERLRTTRQVKLQVDYDLHPRTVGSGSYKVGWKRGKVATADYYAVLYWSDATAARLFWVLFRYYLYRREAVMQRRRALGFGDHPFLFISEQEARNRADGAKFIGAPAGIESYETALERAVRAVGAPYEWQFGTTSHPLRHLYAITIRNMGLPRKILQEGLRHLNPLSSDRYGLPSPAEIDAAIKNALAVSAQSGSQGVELRRTFEWIEERYPEYGGRIL